ncbi:hypothetical protein HG535_0D03940 [Zygotorulaspora mrakii]|uniref:N-alpha-acetyltransferase 40 n=1 Tax=Zygotorulaspora mrakii TaxID=42260 RepID=A0A7H9B2N7_ZYGMR|nr:uncharacterized protein HG535_0D03940 [Zygotorulaspora mrakii]QLG72686.1 hypothetical protein HG535_0D03940 [Zygotorulaspora mrakii]
MCPPRPTRRNVTEPLFNTATQPQPVPLATSSSLTGTAPPSEEEKTISPSMQINTQRFLELIHAEFPDQLATPRADTLHRRTFRIDHATPDNGCPSSATLPKLLHLLATNLGQKYDACNARLYHNSTPWQQNKLHEMNTSGLAYVVYSSNDEPQMFLSFLICEECDIRKQHDQHQVLYLYEIQIHAAYQRMGLGRTLLHHLRRLVPSINSNLQLSVYCIELTVFGDNHNAIRLYKSVGGKLTFGSPKIEFEVENENQRVTRTTAAARNARSSRCRFVIPLYFTFYIT